MGDAKVVEASPEAEKRGRRLKKESPASIDRESVDDRLVVEKSQLEKLRVRLDEEWQVRKATQPQLGSREAAKPDKVEKGAFVAKTGKAEREASVPKLIEQLQSAGNWEARRDAAIELSKIAAKSSPLPDAAAALAQALDVDTIAQVRIAAAVSLGFCGELEQDAKRKLKNASRSDSEKRVRAWATVAILQSGCHSISEVYTIRKLLKDSEDAVRSSTLQALADLGELGLGERLTPLIENLVAVAEDDAVLSVRCEAVDALGFIAESVDLAVPLLTKLLQSQKDESKIRLSAARALGRFGKCSAASAASAVSTLIAAAFQETDEGICRDIVKILAAMDRRNAMWASREFQDALQKEPEKAAKAAKLLGYLGNVAGR